MADSEKCLTRQTFPSESSTWQMATQGYEKEMEVAPTAEVHITRLSRQLLLFAGLTTMLAQVKAAKLRVSRLFLC